MAEAEEVQETKSRLSEQMDAWEQRWRRDRAASRMEISFPAAEITFSLGGTVEIGPIPAQAVPAPTATALATAQNAPDQEYKELAARLGIRSAAILEAELEAVLQSEMIPVYDYDKVTAFLDDQCRLAQPANPFVRMHWRWKPLRVQDRHVIFGGRVSDEVYQKRVPYPALLRVEQISNRLPEAKFFVSEVEQVQDPFLASTVAGSQKFWVIERWDYPGFRG